jgi:sortase A
MPNKRFADELTEAEIRVLLRDRLRSDRQYHLQKYRQTGRAIILSHDIDTANCPVIPSTIETEPSTESKHFRRPNRRGVDHTLLFFEIIAVISLFVLFGVGGKTLANLNIQSKTGWNFPTLTPPPLIEAFVLPDGHTSPNSPGGARPKIEEIPPHLRPLVNVYASIPTPTAAPQQAIQIQIPALAIDAPVVQGDGWEQLKKGVAQHIGSPNPGEKGNMVLSGHNDVYGEVFRYLDRLKPGDRIILFTFTRSYTYIVEGWTLVEPNRVDMMAPTPDETLTLISCYPYLIDTQRIAVKARLSKS